MTDFDTELLKILCCPETRQRLTPAGAPLVEKLNQQIAAGRLRNHSGQLVQTKLDGALVREDGKRLYPIHNEIPVMLVDESIPLPAGL
jgi:uncharacterized protein YbaR (Trm112 family)